MQYNDMNIKYILSISYPSAYDHKGLLIISF